MILITEKNITLRDEVLVEHKTTARQNGILTSLTETKKVVIIDRHVRNGKVRNVRVLDKSNNREYYVDMTDAEFAFKRAPGVLVWKVKGPLSETKIKPEPQADWTWADSIFEASDWHDMVINHVDGSEFIPETGNHVYQLDNGGRVIVTPRADVLIQG